MRNTPLLILCTCPDQAGSERIATAIVDEQLAACVNILPKLTSVYRWEGQVQQDSEQLLLIKTCDAVYPALEARIHELHSYDVPEIIALPIQKGLTEYLDWITENTGSAV